ncbi:MAG: hypothetical protein ABFD89_09015 [Bryobacteraceae bacterium]
MDSQKKTDNAFLEAKLSLRRHMLQKYHAQKRVRVFDACQGSGVLWAHLRREFQCEYWGVDVKPKPGRLTIQSERLLDLPGWDFDVIDVDTYGEPWKHWQGICKHGSHALTVFLTIGLVKMMGGNAGNAILEMAGIRFTKMPNALKGRIVERLHDYALWSCREHGWTIPYIAEATVIGRATARYLGVRLEKA